MQPNVHLGIGLSPDFTILRFCSGPSYFQFKSIHYNITESCMYKLDQTYTYTHTWAVGGVTVFFFVGKHGLSSEEPFKLD